MVRTARAQAQEATRPTGCPVSSAAADFDPFGEDYQQNPPESLRWSRDSEPVFYAPRLGYWVVSRYQDVKAIFRDNETFSPSIALEKITPVVDEATSTLARYGYAMNRTLVNEDEPEHMPRRRALMAPFAPDQLAEREGMVRDLARAAVDSFIDRGSVDLVAEMLYFVPLTVAMHFMGIPAEDMGPLKEYSVAHTVNTWGRPAPEEQVAVAESVGKFWQYAGGVLERMRAEPDGPGWMQYSLRVQAEQPDVVTDSYLHSMMMAGIVAAHETTAHASANAVRLLLEHRDVWDELCADPSLIPNAVEECLRHTGSVAAWRRLVTRDTEIGGVPIPKGAKLLIASSSANHDPRQFENADDFDIRRDTASDHLTFGYGAHQCLGKNLARMEMQIFIEELSSRLPHLQLTEQEFTFVANTSFRGPEHLWVHWDPTGNPERTDPQVLRRRAPVSIGEPGKAATSRPLVVEAAEPVADGVVKLRLVAQNGKPLPTWSPGAHLDVDCGVDANGKQVSRQYSLCGAPELVRAEGCPVPHGCAAYEIAVLEELDGRGGSAWLHRNARVGAVLKIRGPKNHFRLDEQDVAKPVALVAGGIGITPIIAMADHCAERGIDYHLHYAGRSAATMAFLDRLERDHDGRFTLYAKDCGQRMDLAAVTAGDASVYACGPQRLLDGLAEVVPEERFHCEHFTSALTALDPAVEHEFTVELADSGVSLTVPADRTVLDTVRAAGIDVPSDCEEGLCGTCEVPVLDGAIDHRDVVLTAAERRGGRSMMSCCSRACGKKLVLGL